MIGLEDDPASFWDFAYFQVLLLLISGSVTYNSAEKGVK